MQYLNRANAAPLLGEFLGTATLVMVALALSEITSVSYFVATSVAAALGVVYMMFSGLSGAHVNPAITFGMWTARKIGTVRGVSYIIAQLLGGFASWQLYQYFTDHKLQSRTASWDWRVLLAEATGTLVLSMGFAAALTRGFTALEGALTYATSLFAGIMIAATAAAGFLNPAVALGLRSFDWVYILGPLVGALVGINLYGYLFTPATANASAASRASKAGVVVKRSSAKKK
ncbi:MAG TPA: aquaporin [Candidatus Saccharimonadales bacterium]|nr:aquaporin [Candidatus Saccharimonadales bacterium]